jgi:UDP-3-O-[3-hydroxymyristoyl] glucosamine N-acyltransferase
MAEFSAEQLAEMTGGRLVGRGDVTVGGARSLSAAGPGEVAFLRHTRHEQEAANSQAGVLVTPLELAGYAGTMIVCEDVDMAMAAVLKAFAREQQASPVGVSPRASVSPAATVGEGVGIGDFAVVGRDTVVGEGAVVHPGVYLGSNCCIGARTVLQANVCVHDGVEIGADCIIHYGCVIGSRGFGFLQRDGRHVALAHLGSVRIGDGVELGALTTVDRGMLETTVIGNGFKCDAHCHIAHNCQIGPDGIMAAGCMVGGSTRLGRRVMVAADCAFKDHISVGDGAIVAAGSGVATDVAPGEAVWGYLARPLLLQRRIHATLGKLPEMLRRLRELELEVEELRRRLGQ